MSLERLVGDLCARVVSPTDLHAIDVHVGELSVGNVSICDVYVS